MHTQNQRGRADRGRARSSRPSTNRNSSPQKDYSSSNDRSTFSKGPKKRSFSRSSSSESRTPYRSEGGRHTETRSRDEGRTTTPRSYSRTTTNTPSRSTGPSKYRSGGSSRFSGKTNSFRKSGSSSDSTRGASSYTSSRGASSSYRSSSASRNTGGRSSFSGRSSHGSRHGSSRSGGNGRKMNSFDPSQFINKNPAELAQDAYVPKHMFTDFGLSEDLTNTILEMGITSPSPIQDQIIPEILKGRDVIGLAETGTGKTAAFLVPLIEKTSKDLHRKTLILAPTRELAIQIENEFRKLAKGYRMYSTTCVGGMSIVPQIRSLRRNNHFIIGTPGRILDLIKRQVLVTSDVKTVVLDEADRMLDMGFINDMRSILKTVPKERETLFFSATMSNETKKLVNDFLVDPVMVSVKKKDVTNSIEQDVVTYAHHNKFETLVDLLQQPAFTRVIIFGSMKHSVQKLSEELSHAGIHATAIHGNKSHSQRQRALKQFKDGAVQVLVATDVAARGIHVEDVSHVINYDLPNSFDDYVHRIGRTGRGTKRGKALTFVQG